MHRYEKEFNVSFAFFKIRNYFVILLQSIGKIKSGKIINYTFSDAYFEC